MVVRLKPYLFIYYIPCYNRAHNNNTRPFGTISKPSGTRPSMSDTTNRNTNFTTCRGLHAIHAYIQRTFCGAWSREAHGTTEPFGTTRKGCIRYTGVRVDGWFHFIRFRLYTKSVVPEYSLCMRNHGTTELICSPVAYLFTFVCTAKILVAHILSTYILNID